MTKNAQICKYVNDNITVCLSLFEFSRLCYLFSVVVVVFFFLVIFNFTVCCFYVSLCMDTLKVYFYKKAKKGELVGVKDLARYSASKKLGVTRQAIKRWLQLQPVTVRFAIKNKKENVKQNN